MSSINVKDITLTREKFFLYWLQFLKPYHKLRNKEIELLAHFLAKRDELSDKIKDESILDAMLFDKSVRDEIREKMNYSHPQVFTNMLSSLRKKKVIVDGRINKGLIPNIKGDNFKLIFNFKITDEARHQTEKDSRGSML